MKKMLILVQIGNVNNLDSLFDKILKYNFPNNLFIFSILEEIDIDISLYNLNNYVVLRHINKGMDIGPYLLQIKWILCHYKLNDFDYIYKIHTKTNIKWFSELTNIIEPINENIYMSDKWSLNLDNLNKEHINKLCNDYGFKNIYYDIHHNNICYDNPDTIFYSSYYDIILPNCDNILKTLNIDLNKEYIINHAKRNDHIISEDQIQIKQRHKIKFCGGSIFIIKYNIVYEYFSNIDIDAVYEQLEVGYSINNKSTFVHALERIISSFFL